MAAYATTIFLSSFLLFQVQPLIARAILPWFGGSAAVWTTCMLFFQIVLLAGYLYAYCVVRHLPPSRQAWLHLSLLAISLLFLPIIPDASWKPAGGEAAPVLRILGVLASTVGMPYLLLSATTPLLQAWYSRSRPEGLPYRLFALSNAASLLALVTYPPLVEPFFATRTQAVLWSGAYALFAAACAFTALRSRACADAAAAPLSLAGVRRVDPLLWTALPAVSTSLLLAVTTHLTQNIASIPFLWIVPLVLYLLSFILCFEGRPYRRRIWYPAAALGLAAMALALGAETPQIRILLPLFSAGLFACCMVCHGELAALKPDPRRLTIFYLLTSFGGAAGGFFVGVVAPVIFSDYLELHLSLAATGLLAAAALYRTPPQLAEEPAKTARLVSLILAGALAIYLPLKGLENRWGTIRAGRNFYGVLKVTEGEAGGGIRVRTLVHGVINHGQQFLCEEFRRRPVSYYGWNSGVGRALALLRKRGELHVGVIGLGTGTLAACGEKGDRFRFYEINPLVTDMARKEFTYLSDTPSEVRVVMGDARLSLERESANRFDLLAVDAFSGDSIPVHLLTREALSLYFRHVKDDGILAFHITNKYLDLEPVLAEGLAKVGKAGLVVRAEANPERKESGTVWVIAGSPAVVGAISGKDVAPAAPRPGQTGWSDDYSNLVRALK